MNSLTQIDKSADVEVERKIRELVRRDSTVRQNENDGETTANRLSTFVVGDLIGSGVAQEQAIVGETPNLAARLQAAATPSTMVTDPTTRRLLAGLFEYRDLGGIEVKGFAAPVQAYQVVRPSAVESRFEAMHATGLTALVGREEELELLSALRKAT